jgi:hypothetical protein
MGENLEAYLGSELVPVLAINLPLRYSMSRGPGRSKGVVAFELLRELSQEHAGDAVSLTFKGTFHDLSKALIPRLGGALDSGDRKDFERYAAFYDHYLGLDADLLDDIQYGIGEGRVDSEVIVNYDAVIDYWSDEEHDILARTSLRLQTNFQSLSHIAMIMHTAGEIDWEEYVSIKDHAKLQRSNNG